MLDTGRDVGKHDGFAVARERRLQQIGQLGFAERDMTLSTCQGLDAAQQTRKRLVDVLGLVELGLVVFRRDLF